MQYLMIIHSNESGWGQMSPEQQEQGKAAYLAYGEALKKAGVWLGSNRLRPSANSTTVRVANGKTQVLDGPYADTKEQVGGYFVIDVKDLDAALAIAARIPGAKVGSIEVRPILVYS